MNHDTNDEPAAGTGEFVFDGGEASTGSDGLLGQLDALPNSRREFMSGAAKVGAGALAVGAVGSGTAAAKHGDEPYSDSPYEDGNPNGYSALTDVQIVKFALLLERLEANFYTEAVGTAPVGEGGGGGNVNFDADNISEVFEDQARRINGLEIETSASASQFLADPEIFQSIFEYFQIIRDHEQAHVKALEKVLKEVGADPNYAKKFTFNFDYNTADEFVGVARALEDTGAAAYPTAAPAIDIEEYLASAARIGLIEGRHASFLRVLTPTDDDIPFFDADTPLQPTLSLSAVYNRAAPFIEGAKPVDEGDNAAVANALFEKGYAPDTGGKQG